MKFRIRQAHAARDILVVNPEGRIIYFDQASLGELVEQLELIRRAAEAVVRDARYGGGDYEHILQEDLWRELRTFEARWQTS